MRYNTPLNTTPFDDKFWQLAYTKFAAPHTGRCCHHCAFPSDMHKLNIPYQNVSF